MEISGNCNLDDLFTAIDEADRIDPSDTEQCIFRFVRWNHSLKSAEEMANEILQYGWSDTYENALAAIRSNLLFDDEQPKDSKMNEPPSLFDYFDFK